MLGETPSSLRPDRSDGLRLIVLSDGNPAHDRQSRAVAAALGVPTPQVVALAAPRRGLADWLPVPWMVRGLAQMPAADIVLTTGRSLSRVARWLKRRRAVSRRLVFTVQIARPAGRPADFDVVALPWHETQRRRDRRWAAGANNIVVTGGAPQPTAPDELAAEAERWRDRLQGLPEPRLAVLVGGDGRGGPLPEPLARKLIDSLLVWAKRHAGALLVTTGDCGPRVSDLIGAELRRQLLVPYYLWRPDGGVQIDNQHLAYLIHADAVVATNGDMALARQGLSAGKPVYLFGDTTRAPAAARSFFARMTQEGRLTRWTGTLHLAAPAEPLDDAALIAGFVRARWQATDALPTQQLIPRRRPAL